MSTNSRFAVAVHLLAGLALFQKLGMTATSEMAAGSVNTNPVVVRRILGDLRAANLVTSQPGIGGGWDFTQPPATITLRDVYTAVQDESLFAMHHRPPNSNCPVGHSIQSVLRGHFERAEEAMQQELARVTVADVLEDVLAESRAAGLLTPV